MPKPFLLITAVLTVILMALAACTGATPVRTSYTPTERDQCTHKKAHRTYNP